MCKFQFRLESVLKWRVSKLEVEKAALGKLVSDLQALHEELLALERSAGDAFQSVASCRTSEALELRALDAYRRHAAAQGERLKQRMQECDREIYAQRQVLVKAERSVRLLDKLKERQRQEWKSAQDREEESTASELFLAKWRPPSSLRAEI